MEPRIRGWNNKVIEKDSSDFRAIFIPYHDNKFLSKSVFWFLFVSLSRTFSMFSVLWSFTQLDVQNHTGRKWLSGSARPWATAAPRRLSVSWATSMWTPLQLEVHQSYSLICITCFNQCSGSGSTCGSGSVGSICFWVYWIRIRTRNLFARIWIRLRIQTLLSTSKKGKQTLISTVLWLLYDFLSLNSDVNVPSKRNCVRRCLTRPILLDYYAQQSRETCHLSK